MLAETLPYLEGTAWAQPPPLLAFGNVDPVLPHHLIFQEKPYIFKTFTLSQVFLRHDAGQTEQACRPGVACGCPGSNLWSEDTSRGQRGGSQGRSHLSRELSHEQEEPIE